MLKNNFKKNCFKDFYQEMFSSASYYKIIDLTIKDGGGEHGAATITWRVKQCYFNQCKS